MTDEELLEVLAEMAAEDGVDMLPVEACERLTRGEATPEERRSLAEAVERAGLDDRARQAFTPLDQAATNRIAGAVMAEMKSSRPSPPPDLPRRRSRAPLWAGAGVALAAAASLTLVLLVRHQRSELAAPLPVYGLEIDGGESQYRDPAPPPSVPLLSGGARVRAILRPPVPVAGDLEVAVYSVRQGTWRRLEVAPQTSGDGAVRVAMVVGREIEDLPGDLELVFVVGRPGGLPRITPRGPAQGGLDDPKRRWVVLRRALRIGSL